MWCLTGIKCHCEVQTVGSEWARGIITECDLLLQWKSTETFIESPRNHLSLLLVSSIPFAIQPTAIQISTEEEVR